MPCPVFSEQFSILSVDPSSSSGGNTDVTSRGTEEVELRLVHQLLLVSVPVYCASYRWLTRFKGFKLAFVLFLVHRFDGCKMSVVKPAALFT